MGMDDESSSLFTKSRPGAPAGFFAAEAAGLRWLAAARRVPVVEVRAVREDGLDLERLEETGASARAARRLGADLARLHDAGAEAFGWTPAEGAWFGPLNAPFAVPVRRHDAFAPFWAEDRLAPLAQRAAPRLGTEGSAEVEAAIAVIRDGAFDGISGQGRERPARLHGDLWSGNVLWTEGGAVLIDPAAHGGHRLEDLAMLSLFGAPHLEEILAGYEEAHPLPGDWREDVPAHQLFGLLAHVVLFGGSYTAPTRVAARAVTARAERLERG